MKIVDERDTKNNNKKQTKTEKNKGEQKLSSKGES